MTSEKKKRGRKLAIMDNLWILAGSFVILRLFVHYGDSIIGRLAVLFHCGDSDVFQLLLIQILQSVCMLGLVFFFLFGIRKKSLKTIGLVPFRDKSWIFRSALWGAGICVLMMVVVQMMVVLFPQFAKPQDVSTIISQSNSALEWTAAFLSAGILAPVTEEIVFRGYLFHSLKGYYSQKVSIILTALVFGLMHMDLFRLFPFFVSGMFLNLCAVRSGTIKGSMVMHGVWNTLMLVFTFFALS